jgi:hypothetical protein
MKIGKQEETEYYPEKVIPITIPAPAPKEEPIFVPSWPQPVEVPAETGRR